MQESSKPSVRFDASGKAASLARLLRCSARIPSIRVTRTRNARNLLHLNSVNSRDLTHVPVDTSLVAVLQTHWIRSYREFFHIAKREKHQATVWIQSTAKEDCFRFIYSQNWASNRHFSGWKVDFWVIGRSIDAPGVGSSLTSSNGTVIAKAVIRVSNRSNYASLPEEERHAPFHHCRLTQTNRQPS